MENDNARPGIFTWPWQKGATLVGQLMIMLYF